MINRLASLAGYLLDKGLDSEAYALNSLIKYAHSEEDLSAGGTLSVIDLVGNYETGVVLKDKKPQHIINYSEDGTESGNDFTEDEDELSKSAIGLFDVPYGSPYENSSHRPIRDKYRQEDKDVAESFFGAESNIDSEESSPPANIERVDNKPINTLDKTKNTLDKTKFEDFFSFLYSADENTEKEL
jgi:hypothetical protein